MQFRKQGRRVQVLAYRGYDREKRRAVVKLLGSFDAQSLIVTDELLSILTDDEKTELQSYVASIRQENGTKSRLTSARYISRMIEDVSDCVTAGEADSLLTPEYVSELYASIDSLTKAVRKRGFKRPSPKGGPSSKTDTGGSDSHTLDRYDSDSV